MGVQDGKIDLYQYKGNWYMILGECRLKDPTTRKWMDAVMYSRVGKNVSSDVFVREKTDFYEKFIKK